MVSSPRPMLRSASGPRAPHRHPPEPIATDETSTTTPPPPTATTRRRHANHATSAATTRVDRVSAAAANDKLTPNSPNVRLLRQTNSRVGSNKSKGKEPAIGFGGGADLPKPPTKLFVTRPHGGIIQTTNNVQTVLGVREDELLSTASGAPIAGESPSSDGQRLAPPNDDKRTLRSQDGGSRLKSDLSIYFPNYDDVIIDAPKNTDTLTPDTPIYIVDEPPKPRNNQDTRPSTQDGYRILDTQQPNNSRSHNPALNRIISFPSPKAPQLNGAQRIDFSSVHPLAVRGTVDPLPDSFYFKAHRRAERKEKQLRNIERERAMHEKVQLERLLEGLQGHDWLRVMGITGITDSEKKEFEPKRDYFIREVQTLVNKFRRWKEEEKRQKVEKEHAQLQREEGEDEAEVEEGDEDGGAAAEDDEPNPEAESDVKSYGKAPSSNDLDGLAAARQLQLEASFASTSRKSRAGLSSQPVLKHPPSPEKPFHSFYSKPYLRAAALGKHRHGRNVTAFGVPVPEFAAHEFTLPDGYLTADVITANARKRRRLKREAKDSA